jgi:methyltransferase
VSQVLFTCLIAAVAVERLFELRLSRRNERIQLAAGGVEYGSGHYPVMVALHAGLLLGSLLEVWLLARPFIPILGYPMLALVALSAAVRFWVIRTLGNRWTTRVVVVPGLPRITGGPYRFLDHPNYAIVVIEGLALPLVHTGWMTALLFTLANGALLRQRIRVESDALAEAAPK